MEFLELRNRFYSFESQFNMFDLVDNDGLHYWDVFRQEVFETMLYSLRTPYINKSTKNSIKQIVYLLFLEIRSFVVFVKSIICKKRVFVFLASRNKKGSSVCDIQMLPLLKVLSHKDALLFESMLPENIQLYEGYDYMNDSRILRRLTSKRNTFSFVQLAELCNEYFNVSYFSDSFFSSRYNAFISERAYYSFVFRALKVKRIFISQNAVQKAMFSVARELGIDLLEMQHGVIYDGHMAYSYPRTIDQLEKKIYTPSFLLTLSDFWKKEVYLPGAQLLTIGNDNFVPSIMPFVNNKKLLVASSSAHGIFLTDFLLEVLKTHICEGYSIIFKLHPNEYDRKAYYDEKFKEVENIHVTTDEKNVEQWMSECESIFLIESTAAFEALQCGRKVIVLKESSWQTMILLEGINNVYFVSTTNEFDIALHQEIKDNNIDFFLPTNYQKLKELAC